ncbi:DNA packaging protein [Komagataeibacter xylinus]|uniref:DNA packaging protein n=1 Tax=Komagataeibacter xylinus TaxID=28448 RepID=A0A318PMY0_KOMXY|nr:DNA packaging protein [Komagataeibacter xylinus]
MSDNADRQDDHITAPRPTVNKRELANRLRISLPTLTNWLDRWPEFPVVERGRNGVSWTFHLDDVLAFLTARREEEAAKEAGRDAELMKLQMALWPEPVAQPSAQRIPIKERLDLARLQDLQMKQAKEAGKLVNAEELQDLFTSVFGRLGRDINVFIRQLGREQSWPDAMIRQAESKLADMQRTAVQKVLDDMKVDEADDDGPQPDLLG